MQTLKNKIKIDIDKYPYEKLGALEEQLYFDIETTGLSPDSSVVYLIGCAYYRDDEFHSVQFLAEDYAEEELVLYNFFNFAKYFKTLIHYNGNLFDIPYVTAKSVLYDMPFSLENYTGIDIYRRIMPYKSFLNMASLKQKSIEEFLRFNRDDSYNGGELIAVYHDYLKNPTAFKKELLLQHNYDDLRGMLNIVPVLAFCDMFNEDIEVTKVSKNPYRSSDGNLMAEIVMNLELPSPIPVEFSTGFLDCYFTAFETKAKLRVTLFEGELKYFYPNYKEYYYLPEEDMAIHKSVAAFVDKAHREPAKASNCYTKKVGSYLPQFSPLFKPEFKSAYHDKVSYFELTDEIKKDPAKFNEYAAHILSVMASS